MPLVLKYVDPGSGFVFTQGASFLWAVAIGLLGTGLIFLKIFFRFFRKNIVIILILLAAIVSGGLIMHRYNSRKKVVILGIDAMDTRITEALMESGRLPNFSRLKASGTYAHLATTVPSESVVAWSSFSTGMDPGGHGIFDFIMRDENYLPYLSLSEISNAPGKIKIETRRKGLNFWQVLSSRDVPSYIYFCPNTFPPDKVRGRIISGMGVPDITGTMGRFSFYTTRPLNKEDSTSRGKIISVVPENGVVHAELYGPKRAVSGAVTEEKIPFEIVLHPRDESAEVLLQGKRVILKKGVFSQWQGVSFKMGAFYKTRGIVKFYLKSVLPEFELYVTPVNFDPRNPVFPISYPRNYARILAQKVGPYYTQGMPYDTWALTEGRLDERAFLELADKIVEENEKILQIGLKEFKGGVFFFYFETLDIIQHMFWRYLDNSHPAYENDPRYQDTVFKYYEKMDGVLGEILKKIDGDTLLIVLSDHGFKSYRKSVHLNRWLLENNYLALKSGATEGGELFEDIDWAKTKAYALGFGGIYVNTRGREIYGIVDEAEAGALKREIASGLEQFKDPQTAESVVKTVYFREKSFLGPNAARAPDLFVGFNEGYRASWQTALGAVPAVLLEENKKKWSGDHLMDPSLVPGVIFLNRRLRLHEPSITDIAPTVLGVFEIDAPADMGGKDLFKDKTPR